MVLNSPITWNEEVLSHDGGGEEGKTERHQQSHTSSAACREPETKIPIHRKRRRSIYVALVLIRIQSVVSEDESFVAVTYGVPFCYMGRVSPSPTVHIPK